MEEWRNVPGFENYEISIRTKEGKCRSLNWKNTGKVKELSNKPDKRHKRIWWALYSNGKKIVKQAAVWIALTYPELIQNEWFKGAEIDHIDTDRLNNQPSNLKWEDRKGNQNNPLTLKHSSDALKNRVDKSKSVLQYTTECVFVNKYQSISEASRQTGICRENISCCCLGKRYKTAGGYKWSYG